MAKNGNTKAKLKKGTKRLTFLCANDNLESEFKEAIMKGANISLKEASEGDNYSEFAMYVKECLEEGKFTMIEFIERLFEDNAEDEYNNFKENYGNQSNDAFVNFIQDDHGPYSAAMVCETDDDIYIAMVYEFEDTECYFNMLRELALTITNAHLTATPGDINRTVTEKTKETIRKLHAITKPVDTITTKPITEPIFMKL
jgi:hypothetical protein